MAFLAGKISYGKSGDSLLKNFVYLALTMVCYAVGALGFKLSFAYFLHKPMTWDKTLALAVLPFLPLDILKSFLVAFLGIRIRRALEGRGTVESVRNPAWSKLLQVPVDIMRLSPYNKSVCDPGKETL